MDTARRAALSFAAISSEHGEMAVWSAANSLAEALARSDCNAASDALWNVRVQMKSVPVTWDDGPHQLAVVARAAERACVPDAADAAADVKDAGSPCGGAP